MRDAKEGELKVSWSKREDDLVFSWGNHKVDANLLMSAFSHKLAFESFKGITWEPSLIDELKSRGFDLTTLKFSIKKLPK